MDMTLSFYYYYLFLNELFKKNEQKKFDKKKSKQNKQTDTKQNKNQVARPVVTFYRSKSG